MFGAMLRPLLALLLCLLAALPATARAVTHFCGDVPIATADCACDHGAEFSDGDDGGCCEVRQAPDHQPGTSWAPPELPALAALPAPPIALPPAPEAHAAAEASAPWAPVRGPPGVPLFLRHRALLR